MKKLFIIISAIFMMSTLTIYAKEIGGVNLPDTFTAGKTKLILNGGGIRTKWFMDIYTGGLYLKKKNQNPQKIMSANKPMAIRIVVISGLMSSEKMIKAYREGFEKATKNNIAPIKDKIEKFIDAHKGEINKKDIFDLIYVPKKGLTVIKNGKAKTTIKGVDFKNAAFGIWLCDEPADEDLKEGMLGK